MNRVLFSLFILCLLCYVPSCTYAPPAGYTETPMQMEKRGILASKLLLFLPKEQQNLPAARDEARWLANTAYRASAAIARQYDPCLAGWLNNRLVNSRFNLQERGLCWHYSHDLYRELRRRKLSYFRIGTCVFEQGHGSEHNCVFITARHGQFPEAIILDAWRFNGYLKLIEKKKIIEDEWKEDPEGTSSLAKIYTECHSYPMEHWARVKSGRKWNDYVPSWSPEGTSSRQGILMQYNIHKAMKERGGKLTNY